jgi:hypothetical protein
MKRVLMAAAVATACLVVPFQGSAAGPRDATCQLDANMEGEFTGTARDLIVPEGGFCVVHEAIVSRDLIVQQEAGALVLDTTVGRDLIGKRESELEVGGTLIGHDVTAGPASGLHFERTTIGRDLIAKEPTTVQTGRNAPESPGGPVNVGRDVLITGSPEGFEFVFDGICELSVGRDFEVTRRSVTLGIGIGDHCAGLGRAANTIGRDLVVTHNAALVGFFGPSSIEVGNNRVGDDLVFRDNVAAAGGRLEVSGNVVGDDAICSGNDPAVTQDPADGPNRAGDRNTCG